MAWITPQSGRQLDAGVRTPVGYPVLPATTISSQLGGDPGSDAAEVSCTRRAGVPGTAVGAARCVLILYLMPPTVEHL